MQNYKTYLLIFFCTALTLLAVHAFVIWKGFAPYGEGPSFLNTENKIAFRSDGKFSKTTRVSMKDFQAQGYLIGSSRLRDGLDPATAEQLTGKKFFNYGVSGLVIKEMKPMVDHLLAHKNPEIIVIGLDFFAFNDSTKPATDMVLSDGIDAKNLLKLYLSSFSVKSAWEMLSTEFSKIRCGANGFCHDTRFTPTEVAHYIKAGQEQTGTEGTPLYAYKDYNESMELFDQMLGDLKRRNVQVYFYFAPAHILSYHYMRKASLLDRYIEWKNDVSDTIITHGFDLWDFDGKTEATTLKRADSYPYFNDDIHYTKKLGDIILTTLLTSETKGYEIYSVKVTEETLPALLRYDSEAYPNLNPDDF